MSLIELRAVEVVLGGRKVWSRLSCAVGAGEVLVVMGPSGVGKTTLLRVLEGELAPSAGEVQRASIGLRPGLVRRVWQDPRGALNPLRPVLETVAAARQQLLGDNRPLALAAARRRLEDVGLAGVHEACLPHELSAGQRQRAALARALVTDPLLLLADEPTAALDPGAARDLLTLTRVECVRRGMAAVLVLHDPASVAVLADRYLILGPHGVESCGRGSEFVSDTHPAARAVRGDA
jgi:ABC-type dipeptide/oligopeptide/nickel transport system ATPase subunit